MFFIKFTNVFFIFEIKNAFSNVFFLNFVPNVYYNYGKESAREVDDYTTGIANWSTNFFSGPPSLRAYVHFIRKPEFPLLTIVAEKVDFFHTPVILLDVHTWDEAVITGGRVRA